MPGGAAYGFGPSPQFMQSQFGQQFNHPNPRMMASLGNVMPGKISGNDALLQMAMEGNASPRGAIDPSLNRFNRPPVQQPPSRIPGFMGGIMNPVMDLMRSGVTHPPNPNIVRPPSFMNPAQGNPPSGQTVDKPMGPVGPPPDRRPMSGGMGGGSLFRGYGGGGGGINRGQRAY